MDKVEDRRLRFVFFLRVFQLLHDGFHPGSQVSDQTFQFPKGIVVRPDLPVVIAELRADPFFLHVGGRRTEMDRRKLVLALTCKRAKIDPDGKIVFLITEVDCFRPFALPELGVFLAIPIGRRLLVALI